MENETKQTNTNEQEPDIFAQKLREADSLYAILSGCTKEPYVYCDPETMDDAILLFTDEEGAKAGAQKLAEQQIPVGIAKVDRKSLLLFYTSLYTMGVNAIQVHVGEEQKMIQLTEFVRRKDPEPPRTSWRRPSSACTPRPTLPTVPRPTTASTTTSTCPRASRSARTTSPRSRPR